MPKEVQSERLSWLGYVLSTAGSQRKLALAYNAPDLYNKLLTLRGVSSVGRARQWHCRGQRFDPVTLQVCL